MSKYKYTGLLSSQYRSVFKSYHSVDRYDRQFNSKLESQNKRHEWSQLRSRDNKEHLIMTRENFSTISHDTRYPSSRCQSKIKFYTQQNDSHQFHQKHHCTTNIDHQKLLNKIRNKYQFDSNDNFSRKSQFPTQSKRNIESKFIKKSQNKTIDYENNVTDFQNIYLEKMPYKRPGTDFHTISYKNNELRTKVSQINKRRDDIKLKMRVNDIDQINRRFNYLETESNQHERHKLHALQEVTSNHMNLKLERKILDNITNKKTQKLLTKYHEQENIQTPHFHNAETKIKEIDAKIIQKKLQNISKKTFTDFY